MEQLVHESNQPLYMQIFLILRNKIARGEWQPNDRIPSEPELMEQYQVSRSTVRLALDELVNLGLIYRQQGRGSFVSSPKIQQHLDHITNINLDIGQQGFQASTRLLSIFRTPASDQTAVALGIEEGEEIIFIQRLRLVDDEPIGSENSCLVHRYCPGIMEYNFGHDSIYEVLEQNYGIHLGRVRQVVQAVTASTAFAKMLMVSRGAPLLYVERISYSHEDVPIELRRVHYRSDRYAFRTEFRNGVVLQST